MQGMILGKDGAMVQRIVADASASAKQTLGKPARIFLDLAVA